MERRSSQLKIQSKTEKSLNKILNFKSNTIFVRLLTKLKSLNKYLLLLLCLTSLRFQQPTSFDAVSKNKAIFLYGFTKYFEWPEDKKTNNFIIYVVGKNDNLVSELKKLASLKKVGEQEIEIKNTALIDNNFNAHITYFTPDPDMKPVTDMAAKSKGKGNLVIAETVGACKSGASINFLYIESKLKFEYKEGSAQKAGLKTKEEFKKLAVENY